MSVQMRRFLALFIFIFMPFFSANAVVCDVGQYTDGQYCYTCPANASCDDGVKFVCNDGWYNSGGVCTKCSVENATCTSAEDYSCLSGFYDDGKTCNACPENATCAGDHEYFHCKDGYYKQIYKDVTPQCRSCAGHVCEGETLIGCAEGYYKHYTGYCAKCSSLFYCPGGTTTAMCIEGYYKDSNGNCRVCPTGYFCPQGESSTGADNIRDHCASGYYRTGGSCTKCDDDVVCPGGKIEEIVCPDGLYKHDDGRCLNYAPGDCGTAPNCNPGCYNAGNTCTQCVANSTCTSADDFMCNAGYYKNGTGCDICPQNSECPAGSVQINCLPGYWLDGKKQCSNCGTDQYCYDNIQYQCPAYSDGILNPAIPDGHSFVSYDRVYTRNPPNATSINDCFLINIIFSAPEGEYMINSTGYYDGMHYPMYWTSKKYWRSASTGYYLLDKDTTIGWAEFYNEIKPCTNGAPNSYYTGSGSPGGNDCPWVCNDGFYRDGNSCLVCPDGMECVGGGVICPMGMYAEKNQCMPCPSGYTDSQKSGAQSIKDCQIKCIGGTYISKSESQKCENVGEGYWIGENYTNYGATGTKNACEAGMTTIGYGAGADEADDCGRILHIGEEKVYLRQSPRTEPTLVVKYGEKKYYAHTTTKEVGRIRLGISGKVYSVYDDSMADSAK